MQSLRFSHHGSWHRRPGSTPDSRRSARGSLNNYSVKARALRMAHHAAAGQQARRATELRGLVRTLLSSGIAWRWRLTC